MYVWYKIRIPLLKKDCFMYVWVVAWMSVCASCVWTVPLEVKTEVTGSCELLCGCPEPWPVKEKQVLLTTSPASPVRILYSTGINCPTYTEVKNSKNRNGVQRNLLASTGDPKVTHRATKQPAVWVPPRVPGICGWASEAALTGSTYNTNPVQ